MLNNVCGSFFVGCGVYEVRQSSEIISATRKGKRNARACGEAEKVNVGDVPP